MLINTAEIFKSIYALNVLVDDKVFVGRVSSLGFGCIFVLHINK